MKHSTNSLCLGIGCSGRKILQRSESGDLAGLARMVGKIFQVPVAYAAMLGHRDRVMCRIGSGRGYWKNIMTLPVGPYLQMPRVIHDVREELPEGADLGELKFAATAPIDTSCGQHMGVLVIADKVARPEFSGENLETLAQMAAVVADRIEMCMVASQAVASAMQVEEVERRFASLADSEQMLIACYGADGSHEFLNRSWLRFSGGDTADGCWQRLIHQRYYAEAVELFMRAREPFTLDVPMRRHDGAFRWVRGGGTPRLLKDGTFAGFTLCLRDVSDYIDEDVAVAP